MRFGCILVMHGMRTGILNYEIMLAGQIRVDRTTVRGKYSTMYPN